MDVFFCIVTKQEGTKDYYYHTKYLNVLYVQMFPKASPMLAVWKL